MRDYDEYLRFRGCDEGWWIAISVSRSWKVNERYAAQLKEACARVIDGGRYIGGDEVERFESELAAYCGCDIPWEVSNGLDALRLILRGYIEMGVMSPGDEVIYPANTYIATVLATQLITGLYGACRADRVTMNLDSRLIEAQRDITHQGGGNGASLWPPMLRRGDA